ncbi:hypothetical protein [Desulfuromonas sp. TF]|uniref:hypothetical protein n=1 Tax=Desulfuromonas sp. TF TaxID=1232410 RepID=UPI0003F5B005|nr:hypothetical protein [Desulfuromonas sp. TF]
MSNLRDTELPILMRRTVYAGRRLLLIDDEHCNPDGTAMDLTGYAVAGQVRVALDETSAKLADIDFSGSDLPNGIIRGVIAAAGASAIVAGAVSRVGGELSAYFDVKVTDSLGAPEQWYAGTLPVSKVVTP